MGWAGVGRGLDGLVMGVLGRRIFQCMASQQYYWPIMGVALMVVLSGGALGCYSKWCWGEAGYDDGFNDGDGGRM